MAREKFVFRCTICGADALQWTGWCPSCNASGTLVQRRVRATSGAGSSAGNSSRRAQHPSVTHLPGTNPKEPVYPLSAADPSAAGGGADGLIWCDSTRCDQPIEAALAGEEEAQEDPVGNGVAYAPHPDDVVRPVQLTQAFGEELKPVPTTISELDRVLGGGLVPGSVTLLGGEPGIGKSTLLLQLAAALAAKDVRCAYIAAEESAHQVASRAYRLGMTSEKMWLVAETDLPAALDAVDEVAPDVLFVDSIQAVACGGSSSAPGSLGQVRSSTQLLVDEAKRRELTTIIVGHVTKEGGLAGPKALEHAVDTVLSFEGERHHALRLLRAVKHRFGGTHELGLFEMSEAGLRDVPDPSALFLADRHLGIAGSVVAPILEGHRPLLVEVQALVIPTQAPLPRRTAQGVEAGRLSQVLAVLERRAQVPVGRADVHVAVAGGVRVKEPGLDLAIALAVASAYCDSPLLSDLVVCGEVGLGGELRQVQRTDRRLAEAARLGFGLALAPRSAPDPPGGLSLSRVSTLADALQSAGLVPGGITAS